MNSVKSSGRSRVKAISRIGMLGAVAFVLMYFQVPLAFVAPSFMKFDFSDLPILVGAFTMGPVAAVAISALKNVLHILIQGTHTGGIGPLSNFIVGSIFAVTAGVIYRGNKTFKNAIIGLTVGVLLMTASAVVSNYFFIFPLYAKLFMPMEAIIGAGSAITPKINSLWTMMIYSIIPFNLIKGFVVSIVTILVYKKISPLLKG
ncbi:MULTISPECIES: ECF transporter S component [Peptoniphilus]|uniref:ECF transporter S component n=1 Tax=Peptoniphilus TaxID=162289 RepID=UPI0001DA9BF1|nr:MULTISPECIES: ECF transporter S component [Peptoniphilus]EFI42596.1 hypothetical protein HMPREF0629_01251 [Peptoniphilus sp. oral taxon 386 str. F0131]